MQTYKFLKNANVSLTSTEIREFKKGETYQFDDFLGKILENNGSAKKLEQKTKEEKDEEVIASDTKQEDLLEENK